MSRKAVIISAISLLLVPIALIACAYFDTEQTVLLTMFAVTTAIVPFFISFERSRPRPRDIMPIVVLSAIAAVGRIIFAPFPNFKPVSAIVIISGAALGSTSGFMTGALAALASNMFFGQGAWTPWQMYAWGLIGFIAGCLQRMGVFRRRTFVYIYGFVSALLYGFITDSFYIVGFISEITWHSALAGYAAGLPFTLTHAVATVVFLIPTYAPWCRKIERVRLKYGIGAGDIP